MDIRGVSTGKIEFKTWTYKYRPIVNLENIVLEMQFMVLLYYCQYKSPAQLGSFKIQAHCGILAISISENTILNPNAHPSQKRFLTSYFPPLVTGYTSTKLV